MTRRTQACLAFPLAVCVFLAIPLAILTPIISILEPTALEQLDSMADVVFTTFGYGRKSVETGTGVDDLSSSAAAGDTTTTTLPSHPEEGGAFNPGQVFTHRRYRYQGVLTAVLTDAEKRKLSLQPSDVVWYHALIDMRYKKGGGSDHIQHEDVNIIYPGESNFKHPELDAHFSGFDKETSSYLPSRNQQNGKKQKTKKRNKPQKRKKESSSRTGAP